MVNKEKNQKKREEGITLIALVITIIILLILAGVTIATLSGPNGILTRANDAKTETEESKEDELRRLTALEAVTNLENTTHTDNSTGEEKTVTIPAGFAVSQVEGENTIEDGLVIIDSKGNEFVWVPVEYEKNEDGTDNFDEVFVRRAGYSHQNPQDMTNYGEANAEEKNVEIDGTETGVAESSTTVQEAVDMYASVKRNEGFYIGRYEAGTTDKRTSGAGTEDSVLVQEGKNVYNYVGWSNNNDMSIDTGGAVQLARNFAGENGYKTVTSTLCYGMQR